MLDQMLVVILSQKVSLCSTTFCHSSRSVFRLMIVSSHHEVGPGCKRYDCITLLSVIITTGAS